MANPYSILQKYKCEIISICRIALYLINSLYGVLYLIKDKLILFEVIIFLYLENDVEASSKAETSTIEFFFKA